MSIQRVLLGGVVAIALVGVAAPPLSAEDNTLTAEQKGQGWILLFNGQSLAGWTTNTQQPSRREVEDHAINPHRCGGYMLIHEKIWSDFLLALDFKISKRCNSGVFIRTFPLTTRPGRDVGYNGIEVAIDDTQGADFHDTGAIYDLVKPTTNAMHPAGMWNHMEILCDRNVIQVELNRKVATRMDLDQWPDKNKRPDGTDHKFDAAIKDHPRRGYIGLQDHGGDC